MQTDRRSCNASTSDGSEKIVDLSVVCIAVLMETMSLHQLQQVSNVKEEEDWSEDRTMRHSKYQMSFSVSFVLKGLRMQFFT